MSERDVRANFRNCLTCIVASVVACQTLPLLAQRQPTYPPSSSRDLTPKQKTILEIEILTQPTGVGLQGQQWRPFFEGLDVPVRLRSGREFDKVETKERPVGRLRHITVVGQIDDRNRLVFEDRIFTSRQLSEFKEWIQQLQTYGAQGSPAGKPMWGLNKAQFVSVFSSLTGVNLQDLSGLTFDVAAGRLELPAELPMRVSTAAQKQLRTLSQPVVQSVSPTATIPAAENNTDISIVRRNVTRNRLLGVSKGAALAILCKEFGLGFRPVRTPDGNIELEVIALPEQPEEESDNPDVRTVWPIGWDPQQIDAKAAPALYQFLPVEMPESPLLAALDIVEQKSQVPIFVDFAGASAESINVNTLTVSYKSRQGSWGQLLRGVTVPHKLKREIRLDEANNPFVWVTPFLVNRR